MDVFVLIKYTGSYDESCEETIGVFSSEVGAFKKISKLENVDISKILIDQEYSSDGRAVTENMFKDDIDLDNSAYYSIENFKIND